MPTLLADHGTVEEAHEGNMRTTVAEPGAIA